jgi:hypothetical protein
VNAPARLRPPIDEVDTIAIAIARALARQHHAESLASRAGHSEHGDVSA